MTSTTYRIIQDQIARLEANIQETRRQIDAGRTDKPMKMKQKSDLEVCRGAASPADHGGVYWVERR